MIIRGNGWRCISCEAKSNMRDTQAYLSPALASG